MHVLLQPFDLHLRRDVEVRREGARSQVRQVDITAFVHACSTLRVNTAEAKSILRVYNARDGINRRAGR